MKTKNLLAVWLVLLFALSGTLYAKDYTNTSFYVAYDSTDATQYALVLPSVNKVYTHQAGHILPTDLKQVDTQFASFPTYDNGELCFPALASGANGVNGASAMANKCYDVNFFYTQKQAVSRGMTFILTYTPTDKVYEGLAGNARSFKVVKDGTTIQNENSMTNSDYTNYQFDVSTAVVSGVTEGIPVDGVASLSGSVGDIVNPITAVLELDGDGDGAYGGKDDRTLSVATTDGSFTFGNIAVIPGESLKGQLIVTVDGYAPFQKLVSLTDGNTVIIDAASALNKPALKEVVSLASLSSSARMNSVVEFGIRKNGTKVESFSRLISLSQFRAEADLDVDDGRVSSYSFGTASFPADVQTVEVTMQAFDSTKKEDIDNFPGDFRGYGEGGASKADGDEVGLESAAFDLLVMKDQNGQNIKLVSDKLNSNVDLSTCTNKWTRYVTTAQKTVIEGWGDYDTSDPGYQVPIWSNDNSEYAWKFIGIANFDSTNSKFEMCIPDDWGSGYLNCDSPIAFEQPTVICVNTTDQTGSTLSNIYINGRTTSGQYAYGQTNNDGHGSFGITDSNISHWSFTYSGALTGWSYVDVTEVPVAVDSVDCTHELNITDILNPYTATIQVTAMDTHGEVLEEGKYVSLQHSSWDAHSYYKSERTNEHGQVTFTVEPDIDYVAIYSAGRSTVNVNAVTGPDINETADTGVYADVNVTDINLAPYGYLSVYPRTINIDLTDSTRVTISAHDSNPDTLEITHLKVDGVDVTLTNTYISSSDGYLYKRGDLNVSGLTVGTHTVVATVSDGTVSTDLTSNLIIEANRAPVISVPLIAADTATSPVTTYNIDESGSSLKRATYQFTANVYDPDGDAITIIMELNGTIITTPQTLTNDNYEINVTATDGMKSVSRVFNFDVENQKPVIVQAGINPNPVNLSVNEMMMVYAFVTDPDGDGIGSVVATDMNTSVSYTMNTTDGLYYTVDINASEIGVVDARIFEIVAQDAAPTPVSSDPTAVVVSIRDINEAPTFYYPMYDVTIHQGETAEMRVSGMDAEGTRLSFVWTVDGVPFLGAVAGTMAGEEVATLTGLSEGEHVVTCTITDSDPDDPKSVTGTATITVENEAPVFSKEPSSMTVEISADAVFECEATDTDTPVTYAWSVDGTVMAGETGTTLTLNSATEVTHTVSCSAADRFGKTAQSTVANLTVYDPSITHTLTVNVPIPDVTVAIHDESDNLKLIESKLSNASGTATFDVPGAVVTFSISFDPNVTMPESEVWDEVHDDIVGDASSNCQWNNADLNLTLCENADWCALSTADSIPVWVVNAAKVKDSNDVNVTGESMDTNHDESVSSAELYAAVILHEDKNGDGQLSWAEMGDKEYASMIFRDVPIREYTFNWEGDDDDYNEGHYYNFCSTENPTFDINVTNISGYISNLNVSGSGWGYAYESNASKNSFGTKVNVYEADSDANFDFLVKMSGDAGVFYELLLDQTPGTMSDGKTYDAMTLTPPTMIEANITRDVSGVNLYVKPSYKSIAMFNPQYIASEGNTSQYRVLNDSRLSYLIWGSQYENGDDGASLRHGQSNYWGDGTAQTDYRVSDYPMIDVDIDFNATVGRVTYTGTEKDKLDFSMVTIDGKIYNTDDCDYDCEEGLFDITITAFGTPTATLTLSDLNMTEIYPANIATGLTAAMSAATIFNHSVLAYEFKNKTGSEVIDDIIAVDGNFYHAFQAEPSRSVGYSLYRNLAGAAKVSKSESTKRFKLVNPFAIKLNVLK